MMLSSSILASLTGARRFLAGGLPAPVLHRCGSGINLCFTSHKCPVSLLHLVPAGMNCIWPVNCTDSDQTHLSARLAHSRPTCRAALRAAAPLHPIPASAGGRPDSGRGGFRLHAAALQAPPLVPQDHEDPGSSHLLHRCAAAAGPDLCLQVLQRIRCRHCCSSRFDPGRCRWLAAACWLAPGILAALCKAWRVITLQTGCCSGACCFSWLKPA